MRANPQFLGLDKSFWAHVRTLSQTIGYTIRGAGAIRVPTFEEILEAMDENTLFCDHLYLPGGMQPSPYALQLMAYFAYRADVLNNRVQFQLQNKDQAEAMYNRLLAQYPSQRAATMNKQKGDKKTVAFLTAMVNLLIEAHAQGVDYDRDPRQLTTITQNGKPLRTLARRVDGAFPSVVNPIAIWEIKEYYHTTTFGSRVADGVYETMLDGNELEEMRLTTGVHVEHVLIADAHYTWWECGRSYLYRMIDMLHMGHVDEVLFGIEIEGRLPQMVTDWVHALECRNPQAPDAPRVHGQTDLI